MGAGVDFLLQTLTLRVRWGRDRFSVTDADFKGEMGPGVDFLLQTLTLRMRWGQG